MTDWIRTCIWNVWTRRVPAGSNISRVPDGSIWVWTKGAFAWSLFKYKHQYALRDIQQLVQAGELVLMWENQTPNSWLLHREPQRSPAGHIYSLHFSARHKVSLQTFTLKEAEIWKEQRQELNIRRWQTTVSDYPHRIQTPSLFLFASHSCRVFWREHCYISVFWHLTNQRWHKTSPDSHLQLRHRAQTTKNTIKYLKTATHLHKCHSSRETFMRIEIITASGHTHVRTRTLMGLKSHRWTFHNSCTTTVAKKQNTSAC